MSKETTKDKLDRGHNFALTGLVIALIAFSFSIVLPFIIDIQGTDIQEKYWKLMILLISFGAIVNGIFGFLRDGQRYMGAAAIIIAVTAIIAQYFWISLMIIIAVILLFAVLSFLGVGF